MSKHDDNISQVRNRLMFYIRDVLRISVSSFCRNLGVSRNYVATFSGHPRQEVLDAIAYHYPNLNMEWVIKGGNIPMLLAEQNKEDMIYAELKSINNKLDKLIAIMSRKS